MEQFRLYEINWIATFESAGRSREEAVAWMKSRPNVLKPRVRVKMGRQRLNDEGLKMFDPPYINFPWIYDMKRRIAAMTVDKLWSISHD